MPNRCKNHLLIKGTHENLSIFIETAFGFPAQYPSDHSSEKSTPTSADFKKYFCFNATVPTPDDILATGYSNRTSKIVLTVIYQLHFGLPVTEPLDGCLWNLVNWGTTLDIYCDHITPEQMGWSPTCSMLETEFLTAEFPPRAWVKAVAKQFPKLQFHLRFENPDSKFAGSLYACGESVKEM